MQMEDHISKVSPERGFLNLAGPPSIFKMVRDYFVCRHSTYYYHICFHTFVILPCGISFILYNLCGLSLFCLFHSPFIFWLASVCLFVFLLLWLLVFLSSLSLPRSSLFTFNFTHFLRLRYKNTSRMEVCYTILISLFLLSPSHYPLSLSLLSPSLPPSLPVLPLPFLFEKNRARNCFYQRLSWLQSLWITPLMSPPAPRPEHPSPQTQMMRSLRNWVSSCHVKFCSAIVYSLANDGFRVAMIYLVLLQWIWSCSDRFYFAAISLVFLQ